ncbi:MAG: Hsp20/alpha crystallin family protein [Candidatus Hydrogenedentota bacterium]
MSRALTQRRRPLAPWFFDDDFGSGLDRWFAGSNPGADFSPAVDVHETDDAYVVDADLPGMKKEDVKIEILDDTVTIHGSRSDASEEKRDNYHRIERRTGEFKRTFRIPGGFQHDGVKGGFEDGVLHLTLPKLEVQKAKHIEVQ